MYISCASVACLLLDLTPPTLPPPTSLFFCRYTLTPDGWHISKRPSSQRHSISPLKQTTFQLAKQQPENAAASTADNSSTQQQQQQPDVLMPPLEQQQDEPQQQQLGVASPAAPLQAQLPQQAAQEVAAAADPSRGLCLSAFLYCCSRTQLLSLCWQLGLPPSALQFVSRVADADVVLHVKPGKGERHFQYEEVRGHTQGV